MTKVAPLNVAERGVIVGAMTSLCKFAMTDSVVNAGGLQVNYLGQFGEIWVTTSCLKDTADIIFISQPKDANDVNRFDKEVLEAINKIRLELQQ